MAKQSHNRHHKSRHTEHIFPGSLTLTGQVGAALGGIPLRKRSLLTTCFTVVACLVVLGATTTIAAASTMSITVGAEPVESITNQLGVTGTTTSREQNVFLKIQPTGGELCGANSSADHGSEVLYDETGEPGPYQAAVNWTPSLAGSYLLCSWQEERNGSVVASESLTITVRQPHLSLSISAPPSVQPGQTFQLASTAQAETSRDVYEYAIPDTGNGCPANSAAVAGVSGSRGIYYEWKIDGGPFTETTNEKFEQAGRYLFCAYFEYPNRESPPEGIASAMTTVVSPPPPCVVPAVVSGTGLAIVEQKIRAADCTVGSISSVASTKVARGEVLSINPAPGAKLSAGAAVNIVESAGRPCVVPVVGRGSTLAHVEHQLAAADCAASISHLHSRHVRRGRVIGLASRPRTQLSPRAKVLVLVSVGRGRER
jgi:hypothetical protein